MGTVTGGAVPPPGLVGTGSWVPVGATLLNILSTL
jgi:hypothetical protein